ncbi:MAG: hypothetical protein WC655_21800, partial [Candidatus Hydrogenedentales bacterium]
MTRAAICMACVGLMLAGCSGEQPSKVSPPNFEMPKSMTDMQKSVETAVGTVAEKAAAASKEQLAK